MAISLKSMSANENSLASRMIWVSFKDLRFKIRYVSRATMQAIADQCSGAEFVPGANAGQRVRKLDTDALMRTLTTTIVKGWDGVTLRSLQRLMVLDIPSGTDLDAPVEFTEENLLSVVASAHDLDGFLQECATDPSLFKSPIDEDLTKNSKPSQSGT